MLRQFGQVINDKPLTFIVLWLYKHANAKSSCRTSQSGVNQFRKFSEKYFGNTLSPIPYKCMSLKGLLLCFFAGALFLHPKNLKFTTIRNYIGHIRSQWDRGGAPLLPFDKAGLARVLRGISSVRPSNPDSRRAFLLPHFTFPKYFLHPTTTEELLLKAAIVFGFFGMFRFSTYGKLTTEKLILVSESGGIYFALWHL